MGAKSRVNKYDVKPMEGCGTGADVNPFSGQNSCTFPGTRADFEEYRTRWIENCTSDNSGGFLQSKNKTMRACQAKFDEETKDIQFKQYEDNAKEVESVKDKIGTITIWPYIAGFLLVGLIIYLLM